MADNERGHDLESIDGLAICQCWVKKRHAKVVVETNILIKYLIVVSE